MALIIVSGSHYCPRFSLFPTALIVAHGSHYYCPLRTVPINLRRDAGGDADSIPINLRRSRYCPHQLLSPSALLTVPINLRRDAGGDADSASGQRPGARRVQRESDDKVEARPISDARRAVATPTRRRQVNAQAVAMYPL